MDYKERLEAELLEVIEDMKKLKWMNCNADAINAKRMAYESRMEIIMRALELCNSGVSKGNKRNKGVTIA